MYSIADSYIENKVNSIDIEGNPYWKSFSNRDTWQVPIYKFIRNDLSKLSSSVRILEIGSGTGQKATRYFQKNVSAYCGLDQESGISLSQSNIPNRIWSVVNFNDSAELSKIIESFSPEIIVCIDVIEHLEDPDLLLKTLLKFSHSAKIYISTPAREHLEKCPFYGPPRNPLHVREWTCTELQNYLTDLGFNILLQRRFLPRSYSFFSPRDILRFFYRASMRLSLPDSKSCQLVVLGVA